MTLCYRDLNNDFFARHYFLGSHNQSQEEEKSHDPKPQGTFQWLLATETFVQILNYRDLSQLQGPLQRFSTTQTFPSYRPFLKILNYTDLSQLQTFSKDSQPHRPFRCEVPGPSPQCRTWHCPSSGTFRVRDACLAPRPPHRCCSAGNTKNRNVSLQQSAVSFHM